MNFTIWFTKVSNFFISFFPLAERNWNLHQKDNWKLSLLVGLHQTMSYKASWKHTGNAQTNIIPWNHSYGRLFSSSPAFFLYSTSFHHLTTSSRPLGLGGRGGLFGLSNGLESLVGEMVGGGGGRLGFTISRLTAIASLSVRVAVTETGEEMSGLVGRGGRPGLLLEKKDSY